VGKSALTANLAAILGLRGWAVGVLDADIHGSSAALMLGARGQRVMMGSDSARPAVGVANVRVMSMDLFLEGDNSPVDWRHPGGLAEDSYVWRGTLEANVLREFLGDTDWGDLDFLLIDMPPGADRFETLMRLVPTLSGALVVTLPSQVSHLIVRRAIASARKAGATLLGLVENMTGLADAPGEIPLDLSGGESEEATGKKFAVEAGIPYLGEIPFDPRMARATDAGRPLVLSDTQTPTGQALLRLAMALEGIRS